MEILHPQSSAFETYYRSGHAQAIQGISEEYEKLERLTKDAVTWRLVPTVVEPFTVFFNARNMRLVILLGFTEGMEYHPIRVMRQFGLRQGAFVDSTAPKLL